MDPRRWRRVEELFERASLLGLSERARFLRAACPDDPTLVAEVVSLLDGHDAGGPALDRSIEAAVLDAGIGLAEDDRDVFRPDPTARAGLCCGPWRLVREIGAGGMGTVHLAQRADGAYEQQAAVKLVRGVLDADRRARFDRERRALARLAHPNVARLLDGGTTPEGEPFLVMEFVAGTALDRYCDTHQLDVETRLDLFTDVCAAVEHAHAHGVLHRDVKAENVLVGSDGVPKLVDFGVSKLDTPSATTGVRPGATTGTFARMVTPESASPEELSGARVGPESDVWSLGVLLHVLLVGCKPFERGDASTVELARRICEVDPPRVSRRVAADTPAVTSVAADRGTTPRVLRRRVAGDLDLIVERALQKDPARRYPTAAALAADVQRHQAGRPVEARRGALVDRARKALQRHRGAVLGTLLVLALALAAAWFANAARDAGRVEVSHGVLASAERRAVDGDLASAGELLDETLAALAVDQPPAVRARALAQRARGLRVTGRVDEARAQLDAALEAAADVRPKDVLLTAGLRSLRGSVLRDEGRWEAADRDLAAAEEAFAAELGAGAARRWEVHLERARVRHQRGRFRDAESWIRASARGLAAADARTARADLALAELYADWGDYGAALDIARAACSACERELGEEHLVTAEARTVLGRVLLHDGRPDDACELLARAHAVRSARLERGRWERERGASLYGAALAHIGRFAEAEELLLESQRAIELRFGPDHWATARAFQRTVDAYLRAGRPHEAELWRARITDAARESRLVQSDFRGDPDPDLDAGDQDD